jgi:hypothetical protein
MGLIRKALVTSWSYMFTTSIKDGFNKEGISYRLELYIYN